MNTKQSTTGWERRFSGNSERDWILTILSIRIWTNQNSSNKMKLKNLLDFTIQTNHPIFMKIFYLVIIIKIDGWINKEMLYQEDFAVPANHKVEIKESEYINRFVWTPLPQKNLWNIIVTVILIVVSAFGTIPKFLEREWKNWKSEERSGLKMLKIIFIFRIIFPLKIIFG